MSVMQYGLTRTVEPAVEPITKAQLRQHAGIDEGESDATLDSLIAAVRDIAEHESERSFITQTWQLTLECFPSSGIIELPRPPLISVTSVAYLDADEASQTFSSSKYTQDTTRIVGRVWLNTDEVWPITSTVQPNAVTVTYTAGYGAVASSVPGKLTWAMLGHAKGLYEEDDGLVNAAMHTYRSERPGHV